MPMKVRYTLLDGELVSENRAGQIRDYVPDARGSTLALLDNSQVQTDTFTYWPYGEERLHVGSSETRFRFIGAYGYYRDTGRRAYVRARYLDSGQARWLSTDPLHSIRVSRNTYAYCGGSPTVFVDPSGLVALSPDFNRIIMNAVADFVRTDAGQCLCLLTAIADIVPIGILPPAAPVNSVIEVADCICNAVTTWDYPRDIGITLPPTGSRDRPITVPVNAWGQEIATVIDCLGLVGIGPIGILAFITDVGSFVYQGWNNLNTLGCAYPGDEACRRLASS